MRKNVVSNAMVSILSLSLYLGLASPSARAQLLNVDFQHENNSGPPATQGGFMVFQNDATATVSDMRTFATAQGDIDVTIGSKNTLLDGFFNRNNLAAGVPFSAVYNDFAFDNAPSGGSSGMEDLTLSLSGAGVTPNALYELTFYSFDPLASQGTHDVDITGVAGTIGDPLNIVWTGSDIPVSQDQFAATGIFQADATGALNFLLQDTFAGTESTGIRLNAFQLAAVAVPEPASVALWGMLGAAALACWRLFRKHPSPRGTP